MAPQEKSETARKSPRNKVIITCAVTGAIHTPTLSPALPFTPADIAAQAIAAAEAGAAILHLHARDPRDGSPTGDPNIFAEFLPQIHAATDAVINLTTGGSPEMTVEQRLAASLRFRPEMCSLNMGSMNFSFHLMGSKIKEWKFPWEKKYIEDSASFIFRNTFTDVTRVYQLMSDFGTRYEHECYDIGHLYNLAYFLDRKLARPPLFIQSVFGILGGIGADPDNVVFMRRTADRLFGDDYVWSALAAGRHQMPIITQAAMLGGNVRVGLEDSLFIGRGRLAASNAEQVSKIRRMLEELGFEIATPAEARSLLALKGKENVAI
jgi:3,5-dioxohexanoate:acetyl-CoA acetone transferase